ncbi:MAG TPA: BadF/BadG/BcrA/BcrD ATPase family protein [Actinospica sp.]|nr:BadF/BadG/BcrA/BcrD ATPase family protein [Actinospica sp.]
MPDLISGVRVGIDVGGTKTHLRAFAGPRLLADQVYSSEGWVPADFRRAAGFLADLISRAIPGVTPVAVAVGAHGCDSAEDGAALAAALEPLVGGPCLVLNDAELLAPAVGLGDGIGLVAGTGSVAVGRDAAGRPVYVGGWGWLFGDEGSAPGLIREAARASLAARDRGEDPDLLAALLLDAYQVSEVMDLPDAMAAQAGAREWGSRAALVFEALDGGSALAESVIEDAAGALAQLVVQVAARGVDPSGVAVGGGVILNQPRLYDAFVRRLAAVLPGTVVHRLEVPPVQGALVIAERMLHAEVEAA